MSIHVLDGIYGSERRLTLQDDMESLLYVVLYCALVWQPHSLPRDTLTQVIHRMFDEYVDIPPGPPFGGQAKLGNAQRRAYTGRVQFESHGLHEWLNTMMNYLSPLQHHGEEFRNKWSDPAFIQTFWADFLAAHSDLEPANRFENMPYPLDIHEDPISPSPSHHSPQLARSGPSHKRRREPSKIPPLRPTRSSLHRTEFSAALPHVRRSGRLQQLERKKTRLDLDSKRRRTAKGGPPAPRGRPRQVSSRK